MAFGFSGPGIKTTILAALLAGLPVVASAQERHVTPPSQQKKILPEPPAKLPKVGADRTRGLDFLFGALKAAPDQASAKHVEARIWALWLQTPSDTAALLMMRAKAAMEANQMDVAQKLLDAVLKLRPDDGLTVSEQRAALRPDEIRKSGGDRDWSWAGDRACDCASARE